MTGDPPFDPRFEQAIRDDEGAGSRLAYADWLERHGASDRAGALRRYRPPLRVPPVDLRDGDDPEDVPVMFYGKGEVPLILLVLADFTLRPDPRPIEDRKEIRVPRGGVDKVLSEWKLRFDVDVDLPDRHSVEVKMRKIADFESESVAAQLARSASLGGADLDRAVAAALRDPRVVEAERVWRSLHTLVESAPEGTLVVMMNATKDDLLADLEDAPEFEKAGMFRMVNCLNHSGMQPPGALVIGWPLSPTADARLLEALARVGRARTLPVLAPTTAAFDAPAAGDARHDAFRATPDARFVALCAPSFVLRPARAGEVEPLAGPASFLVARLLAESFAESRSGAGIRRKLPGVTLERRVLPSESALAGERGYLTFVSNPDGATLHDDVTHGAREAPAERSLSVLFVLTRIAQIAMNVHHRRGLANEHLKTSDAAAVAEVLRRGLATRFCHAPGLEIALGDPRWIRPPIFWDQGSIDYGGTLDVEVALTLPPSDGRAPERVRDRVVVRLGY
jgi:uncharacterized protein (TIGR02996 family)